MPTNSQRNIPHWCTTIDYREPMAVIYNDEIRYAIGVNNTPMTKEEYQDYINKGKR